MEFACLELVTRRDFLVRPRAVSDSAFEQSTIFELVSENLFEEVEVGNRFGIFQNGVNYSKSNEKGWPSSATPAMVSCLNRLATIARFIGLGSGLGRGAIRRSG